MAVVGESLKTMIIGLVLIILVVNILPVALSAISGLDLSNVGGVDYSWAVTILQIVIIISFIWLMYEHFMGNI